MNLAQVTKPIISVWTNHRMGWPETQLLYILPEWQLLRPVPATRQIPVRNTSHNIYDIEVILSDFIVTQVL